MSQPQKKPDSLHESDGRDPYGALVWITDRETAEPEKNWVGTGLICKNTGSILILTCSHVVHQIAEMHDRNVAIAAAGGAVLPADGSGEDQVYNVETWIDGKYVAKPIFTKPKS